MKESISYSFLLNIVILFVFVAFAIIMGSLSYYRAFKANSIISESIEKYEGYNCLSKDEIEKKLATIGYKTPFNVTCNSNDGQCEANTTLGYKIIAYDLDFESITGILDLSEIIGTKKLYDEPMNSSYICNRDGCATNKHYQYGIYTYMYVDMPIISNILRVPFFARTSTMYEFRNYYVTNNNGGTQVTEVESIFDQLYDKTIIRNGATAGANLVYNGKIFVKDAGFANKNGNQVLSEIIFTNYATLSTGGQISIDWMFATITGTGSPNLRNRVMIELLKGNGKGLTGQNPTFNNLTSSLNTLGKDGGNNRRQCGYHIDYGSINF